MIDQEKLEGLMIYYEGIKDNFRYLTRECKVVPLDAYRRVKQEMKNCQEGIVRLRKSTTWTKKK